MATLLIIKLLNPLKYLVRFQPGEAMYISGNAEQPLGLRGVFKNVAKGIIFVRSRVIPKGSQKKELTTYLSQAGRKPSQVMRQARSSRYPWERKYQ